MSIIMRCVVFFNQTFKNMIKNIYRIFYKIYQISNKLFSFILNDLKLIFSKTGMPT